MTVIDWYLEIPLFFFIHTFNYVHSCNSKKYSTIQNLEMFGTYLNGENCIMTFIVYKIGMPQLAAAETDSFLQSSVIFIPN